MRYQGLVGLDVDTMAEAFEGYFAQSEQLPTRMLLAANARAAVGLMVQKLPDSLEDEDGWPRAVAVLETLDRDELLDTPPHDLLYRLFHEDRVAIRDARPLRFGCSCSRERVSAMLQGLGQEEALASISVNDPPAAEVSCAFCGRTYRLSREEIQSLFNQPSPTPAPDTLQ